MWHEGGHVKDVRFKLFVSREERYRTLNDLDNARERALSADDRGVFIQAIHDFYPNIPPDRVKPGFEPQPPEDYLALRTEFHNLILPSVIPVFYNPIFIWILMTFINLPLAIVFVADCIKGFDFDFFPVFFYLVFFVLDFWAFIVIVECKKKAADLREIGEKFQLFFTPEEKARLDRGYSTSKSLPDQSVLVRNPPDTL